MATKPIRNGYGILLKNVSELYFYSNDLKNKMLDFQKFELNLNEIKSIMNKTYKAEIETAKQQYNRFKEKHERVESLLKKYEELKEQKENLSTDSTIRTNSDYELSKIKLEVRNEILWMENQYYSVSYNQVRLSKLAKVDLRMFGVSGLIRKVFQSPDTLLLIYKSENENKGLIFPNNIKDFLNNGRSQIEGYLEKKNQDKELFSILEYFKLSGYVPEILLVKSVTHTTEIKPAKRATTVVQSSNNKNVVKGSVELAALANQLQDLANKVRERMDKKQEWYDNHVSDEWFDSDVATDWQEHLEELGEFLDNIDELDIPSFE
ncbi:MAG: hypothetical protein Q8909_02460 [Bacteroidota bacterium]|nr:hypothetical protein [Bacteroidota bacterium]